MTPLQTVSAISGLAVAFAYFGMFHWAIRRMIAGSHYGRWLFVVGAAVRQVLLGLVIIATWWAGMAWPWVLGGLVAGAMLHRALLLMGPLPTDASAFVGTSPPAPPATPEPSIGRSPDP